MRVLGIDPGLAQVGLAMVERVGGKYRVLRHGCVETAAGGSAGARLERIASAVESFAGEHGLTGAAMEKIFFGRSRRAVEVAMGMGAMVLALARAGLDVALYTPHEVKLAAAGYGHCNKAGVKRMLMMSVDGLADGLPDHVYDAVGVAVCYLARVGLEVRAYPAARV